MSDRQAPIMITISAVVFLVLIQLALPATAGTNQPILLVNGASLQTEPAPIVRSGRLFLPATSLRKLGLAVEMRGRNSAWVAWPASEDMRIYTAGSKTSKDQPAPFIYKSTLMLPLREIVDGKIMILEWEGRSKIVRVRIRSSWKEWRSENDAQLQREHPNWYETPIFTKG